MARSRQLTKDQKDQIGLLKVIGFFGLLPVFLFTILQYVFLRLRFSSASSSGHRIDDPLFMFKTIPTLGLIAFVFWWLCFQVLKSDTNSTWIVWLALPIAIQAGRLLASRAHGVVISKEYDIVIFPQSWSNFGLFDWLTLRPLWSFAGVGYVKLSDVENFSREKGRFLYIHGKFGSRKLQFSNKQRRDEAISAVESMTSSRSLSGDFWI